MWSNFGVCVVCVFLLVRERNWLLVRPGIHCDFEPNSDSCDSLRLFFLSRAEFQLCHASFVVQCTGENEKRLASPDRQSDGRMNFWHVWNVGCSSWRYRTFEAELRTDCHKLSAFSLTAPAQKQYFNYLNFIAARKKTKRGRSLDFAISYKKNTLQNYKYFSFKSWRRTSTYHTNELETAWA